MAYTTKRDVSDTKRLRTITSYSYTSGVATSSDTVSLSSVTANLWEKTWVRTPGFRQLKSTGQSLPDNSYTYTEWRMTPTYGRCLNPTQYGVNGWTRTDAVYGPYVGIGVFQPQPIIPESAVYFRLIEKVKGQQWNASVFLAEGRKTSTMVAARATHLALMANALLRGNFPGFVKRFHQSVVPPTRSAERRFNRHYGRDARAAAGNAWLEYSYGWRPFMGDVRDAVNTLMDVADQPEKRVCRVSASMRTKYTTNLPEGRIFTDTGLNLYVRGYYVRDVNESLRVVWRCSPNAADLPARFGLLNPAEVVWELVPFSFVVDWFLPIGDYLSALDVPFRFNHLGGTVGRRVSAKMTTIMTRAENPNQAVSGFTGHSDYFQVTRTRLASVPVPKLSQLMVEANLGSSRVASSLALLNQQLSRLRR